MTVFKHMLHMTTVSSQALLDPESQVVYHSVTLYLFDGFNIGGHGLLELCNGFRTIIVDMVFQEPPREEIWGI